MAIFKKEGNKYNKQFYKMVDEGLGLLEMLYVPVDNDEKKDSYKNSLLRIIEEIFSVKRLTNKANQEEAYYPNNKPSISNKQTTTRSSSKTVNEVQSCIEENEPSNKRVRRRNNNE